MEKKGSEKSWKIHNDWTKVESYHDTAIWDFSKAERDKINFLSFLKSIKCWAQHSNLRKMKILPSHLEKQNCHLSVVQMGGGYDSRLKIEILIHLSDIQDSTFRPPPSHFPSSLSSSPSDWL